MEEGYDFDMYGINKQIKSERLSEHFSNGILFHNQLKLSFFKMAPAFAQEQ